MSGQRKFGPDLLERMRTRWCRIMHDSPMWPIGGRYRCRSCGRIFLVPWDGDATLEPVRMRIRPDERTLRRAA